MKKTLASALVTGGVVIGSLTGVAMASADAGDRDRADETTESTEDTGFVNVQDATEDGDNNNDGENEGRRGRSGQRLSLAAEVIGIEADELRMALEDGQSVAEVAEDNGVDAQDVIDAMVASLSERLDAKVAEGDLTADEAAEKLEGKTERISNKVNGIDDDNEAGTDEASA